MNRTFAAKSVQGCGKAASGDACGTRFTARPRTPSAHASRRHSNAPPDVHEVLQHSGRPLPEPDRHRAERLHGLDLSRVRIHTDDKAAASAAMVRSNAYTVGHDIVFARNRFSPGTPSGQRLIDHELAHVVQQRHHSYTRGESIAIAPEKSSAESAAEAAARGARPVTGTEFAVQGPLLQRDLATPPPEVTPPVQPDLTPAQIRSAIAFNRSRYDAASTRIIQDLVGTEPTGTWTEADVVAVAEIQEEYGLTKDGKVGFDFFQWLNEEQRLEGAEADQDCLVAFRVVAMRPVEVEVLNPPNCALRMAAHFRVEAQFSERCDCSQFRYRQFIRGEFELERGGTTHDIGDMFQFLPAGRLNSGFDEDGNTQWAAIHYGDRNAPGQPTTDAVNAENHYIDNQGRTDQANGCRYRGEDHPNVRVTAGCQSGDRFRLNLNFRGEILRGGSVAQTLHWTAINQTVVIP